MRRISKESQRAAQRAITDHGVWVTGVTGIVADNHDPEKQHRVKVVIPSIDENVIFDEWARQMVFCLGSGYGSAFIPPKGSEVVLFGQLGQKFNLFYASLYNEEMVMPAGFPDEMTVGVHAPGNLKLIAELLARIEAENIEIEAAQLAKITGQNTELTADQLNKLEGNEIRLNGVTIKVNGSGDIEIAGGNVKVTGTSIKLHGRTVNTSGPPI